MSTDVDGDDAYLQRRLQLTAAGCASSIVCLSLMFYAYWKHRQHLRNGFNDLYCFGLAALQLVQCCQKLLFAIIFMNQTANHFSAHGCLVNAVLTQTLDFAAQICSFGFFYTILTMRRQKSWLECCGCDDHYGGGGGGVSVGGLNGARVALSQRTNGAEAVLLENSMMLRQRDGNVVAMSSMSCMGRAYASFRTKRYQWLRWLCTSLFLGSISALVMYASIVSDADMSPQVHDPNPKTFTVSLGWCWIPRGNEMLRLGCCYLLSLIVAISIVVLFVWFQVDETRRSIRTHVTIYTRLVALFLYVFVAYSVGDLAQSGNEDVHHVTKEIATFLFAFYGGALAIIFMVSEKLLFRPLFLSIDAAPLPGDGFSRCVTHLLDVEVVGVTFPPPTSYGVIDSQRNVYSTMSVSAREWDDDGASEAVPPTSTSRRGDDDAHRVTSGRSITSAASSSRRAALRQHGDFDMKDDSSAIECQ